MSDKPNLPQDDPATLLRAEVEQFGGYPGAETICLHDLQLAYLFYRAGGRGRGGSRLEPSTG